MSRAVLWVVLVAACAAACIVFFRPDGGAASRPSDPPTSVGVAVAASLHEAFQEVGRICRSKTGVDITVTSDASGVLRSQILEGAPIDIFVPADAAMFDDPALRAHMAAAPPLLIGRGALMLAAHPDAAPVSGVSDLPRTSGPIVLPNPETAPFGRAAMEAMSAAGAWEALRPRLVMTEGVRRTLALVEHGDAAYGFVPAARADVGRVRMVAVDVRSYRPLIYAAAFLKRGEARAEARRVFEFLAHDADARRALARHGVAPVAADEGR